MRQGLLGRLLDALEERIGLISAWRHLADEPIPGGARFAFVFGSALLALLGIQFASGAVLATDYSPSVDAAHASVARLMDLALSPLGWLVRALHHHGASFLVIAVALHLAQVAIYGAYRRPREANWISGLLLGGLLLAFAFTGYLLPWDDTAYFATRVGLNIARSTPLVGPSLATLLQGGGVMGNLTLTRFYALHVLFLPAALVTLAAVHLVLFRRHGVTTRPGDTQVSLERAREPFWPGQLAKDSVAVLGIVLLLVAWAAWRGAPLGARANPAAPFDARPEWYFFWLFQLLAWFEPPWDWIATMGIPGLIGGFLFVLPWIDRGDDRSFRARRLAISGVLGILGFISVLTAKVMLEERSRKAAIAATRDEEPATLAAAAVIPPLELGMLYGEKCTKCHYRTGAPNDPDAPDFRDPEFARMGLAHYGKLVTQVKEGGEIMPAFADELSDAQIDALLDEIVLKFPETNPIPRESGASGPAVAPGGQD